MPQVSVICPLFNEELFVERCIYSVLRQDYPFSNIELLLVDGMSTDHTRQLILPFTQKYPNIHLLDNPHRTVPYAMNIGLNAADGEFVIRIDAHAEYSPNYISTLLQYLSSIPNAANVGAVCITLPRQDTPKGKAIVEVLTNRMGVGNALFRTGISEVTEVDTVPFGCYRKQTLIDVGGYDKRLTRNQDIELNKRIKHHGGQIYLVPNASCTYYARSTFADLAQNNFQNGRWNILTVFYTHDFRSLSLRHFVPLCFILALFLPLCFIPLWRFIGLVSAAAAFAYCFLFSVISIRAAINKHLNPLLVFLAFLTLHVSYGCGSLIGILSLPFIKTK